MNSSFAQTLGKTQADSRVREDSHPPRNEGRSQDGFTIIEVVLAIGIAIGLLMVVLFFYQQTAKLRTDLIEEAEKISVARMFLERITSELRAAITDDFLLMGVTGGSNFVEFVTAGLPAREAWAAPSTGPAGPPPSDLKIVRYQFSPARLTLTRFEEPLVETLLAPQAEDEESDADAVAATPQHQGVTIDTVRLLHLRYWDGTEWAESWNDWELPQGIEVTIGSEPWPEDGKPGDYVGELFRRVIALPVAGRAAAIERVDLSAEGPPALSLVQGGLP